MCGGPALAAHARIVAARALKKPPALKERLQCRARVTRASR
jgi:hypothetical protein